MIELKEAQELLDLQEQIKTAYTNFVNSKRIFEDKESRFREALNKLIDQKGDD